MAMTAASDSCYLAAMATLKQQIKQRLVETLGLKIAPDAIDDNAPLFVGGLGLDSVDVLEIAAMLSLHFNVEITNQDSGRYREIFASIRSLADFVRERQAASA